MTSRVKFSVEVSGPLADGTASVILQDVLQKTKREIADAGAVELKTWLMDKSGRATGFFQRHITVSSMRKYKDAAVIGAAYPAVLYGPWLEGVSERNRSTRFPGYHLFRLTAQKLRDEIAPEITRRNMEQFTRRAG